ncbi:restriction endonuclease subunit S [Canibacter sp. lx-45]|uniref:restriction endonuclease subunit S n=1 Tax=Canibacter zhuwentaonis TaxID=2837491 RepID=UPI001BDBD110|nr:restriction endonuclease subunit S [Canibacter zhuwentaonis]MBT1035441.1 restriction endonuclease subunit S [Canibacter zhuwentaonis]
MGSDPAAKTKRRRPLKKSLSPALQKLKDDFTKAGGEWRDTRVGDLFEIRPTKNYGLTNQRLFETKGNTPVVVNSSLNNGIGGYVNLEPTEKRNTVTFSDTTTSDSIFYQPNDFIGYSHVQGMFPFRKWSKLSLLYFVISFRAATRGKFDYGNKFNRDRAKEVIVTIPYKKQGVAFSYMEAYISELEAAYVSELEAAYVSELEAYLKASGLDNYELSNDEQAAVKLVSENKIKWSKYKYNQLFKIEPIKLKLTKENLDTGGKIPVYSSISGNNGIMGYTKTSATYRINEETSFYVVFGDHTRSFNIASADFCVMDNVKVLKPLQNYTLKQLLFIISSWKKGIVDKGYSRHWSIAKDLKIQLPTKNGEIDFDFITTLVVAIQKLVIKDVVLYAEMKIAATKEVIGQN